MELKNALEDLSSNLSGKLHYDELWKSIYATDASVYREIPLAVAFPRDEKDLLELIKFAKKHGTSLIPRTAGTSLAGQCTGDGIVVDVSKHFTDIIKIEPDQKRVVVEPGVIRDDLNRTLEKSGLFFGPNTSTSNRCMIGGMVGNNSSGTTSIKYGTTRDKLISLKVLLSDGTKAEFKDLSLSEYQEKLKLSNLEGEIYRLIDAQLTNKANQDEILNNYPPSQLHRRNTGYAIDDLLNTEIFSESRQAFNFSKLIAGSEGTLAFITEITLQLDELPPENAAMVAAHFSSVDACMQAVVPVMKHSLYTCEMMDKVILDCTKESHKYRDNRFFIEGDPQGILMLELRSDSEVELQQQVDALLETLSSSGLGYAYPVLYDEQIHLALELRKAGLGLLANLKGDKKAVACIEDTAVAIPVLADYISDFSKIMESYDQQAVYYAHAGAGEIHLRPILNLKKSQDVALFRNITKDVATLVKKYNGSLSGEHGDGRVRAEFIELMFGKKIYELLKEIKFTFDPDNIFNPGKIVDAPPMDSLLRYVPDREEPEIETIMDFSDTDGILRLAEKCNGSGDCRKSVESGGTMCPSYRATKDEKDTTRARANALREFLTNSNKTNRFDHPELKEVLDLCISCKGCKSECPSNVDMAALKAEFLHQYHQSNNPGFRDKAFANITQQNARASKFPKISRFIMSNTFTSGIAKNLLGVAKERELPVIAKQTLKQYYLKNIARFQIENSIKTVYLFNDEFTNYLDVEVGKDALNLLARLGYKTLIIDHPESGRSQISKGFLNKAKELANKNVSIFKELISDKTPLIGVEPSAILSFRDEYLRLADDKIGAQKVAKNSLIIEEFLKQEIALGNIKQEQFTSKAATIKIHGHCHQKALSNVSRTFDILNFPKNYKVTMIPSGCCGMAGSFGYEKEHYEISMRIGENSLFPAIRKADKAVIISANGTSCRHQIKDGTGRIAQHPVSILRKALKKS
ncbi:FAD-binding and (Fe-S)-binding domain-containing protein [Gramella sp. MAR_2010_147]|uniref:FAD-binding and (Fe-S)-binding domain-containing protein n=1 Tax=Gramella sp. MAR_2010_147 TaxID=1250205 RepID=UPI00087D123C|nr:FAD-binding and (Fe-S)-binding domain-containing protein [Gramella sp. MAR_2010_147]SDR78323.1 FAD/FMN-containing dehydrogenase [Gramella sp. MAR_2010_147]